tara:strand:+ start:251 stop:442 length:192 start_codon:yes stop_codon:yes gene_type:complete
MNTSSSTSDSHDSHDSRIGHALVKWGVGNVAFWQAGERLIGREETERLYPESKEFFQYLYESR